MKVEAISQELEEMIWKIADSNDEQLETEFYARYPQHASVLEARKRLVQNMRSAKPVAPIATRFVPTGAAARPRYWLVPLAAGLLVGMAMASYQIVKFAQATPKEPEEKAAIIPQSPVPTPRQGSDLQFAPTPVDPGTAPRPEELVVEEPLVAINVENARLFGVLSAIEGAGLQIEIMPGVEDAPVMLKPNGEDGMLILKPLAMLKAVQSAAEFELVDAGPDGYLVLPKDKTTVVDDKGGRSVESDEGGN